MLLPFLRSHFTPNGRSAIASTTGATVSKFVVSVPIAVETAVATSKTAMCVSPPQLTNKHDLQQTPHEPEKYPEYPEGKNKLCGIHRTSAFAYPTSFMTTSTASSGTATSSTEHPRSLHEDRPPYRVRAQLANISAVAAMVTSPAAVTSAASRSSVQTGSIEGSTPGTCPKF